MVPSTGGTPVPRGWCRCLAPILLVIATLAVAFAIQLNDGEYTPVAIGLVGIALACTAASLLIARRFQPNTGATSVAVALGVALGLQFLTLLIVRPSVDLPGAASSLPIRIGLLLATAGAASAILFREQTFRRGIFPALVLIFLAVAAWVIHASPSPHIDVWVFERDAARELLHGRNPYAMTFPDIYHSTLPGYPQEVYGKGLVVNDRCQFGFPYPPVTLLLTTLGYVIAGDPRYAQAFALAIAGLLIGFSGRGRVAASAALLLLFTPRVFFVLGRAWTEPFAILLLAATIFLAVRRSRWLFLALGLFLATKQYLVLAVPFTFFLLPTGKSGRHWIRLLALSAIVMAAVTLPFALWNFPAFWKSTVTVQKIAPFRWDSLSFIVWWGFHGHGDQVKLPNYAVLPATIASLVAMALSLWRSPRSVGGFAGSLALLSLAFFAFNKQAFCNYYFFVIGALCCAIAARSGGGAGEHTSGNVAPGNG